MKQRYRLRLTREAGNDLEAVHSYIAARSPANASRIIQRLLDSIQGLRLFPHHTVVADHPDGAIRSLPVPPHVVYFQVIERHRMIVVITVQHGARTQPDFQN